jgi:tRNA/rRNA methyltransferase
VTEALKTGALENFHIVLVEPGESLNVGSVARAMDNLGFVNLHLVNPKNFCVERAGITACWAKERLDCLHLHDDLESALSNMQDVIGFSSRSGKWLQSHPLPQWASGLTATRLCRTALVFGPEDNGLSKECLEQCRLAVSIPSRARNPSYNLAQAVLLALAEIGRHLGSFGPASQGDVCISSWSAFEQVDQLLTNISCMSGFTRPGTPPHIPGVLRSLFRRIQPSEAEMAVLLGFLGRAERSLARIDKER